MSVARASLRSVLRLAPFLTLGLFVAACAPRAAPPVGEVATRLDSAVPASHESFANVERHMARIGAAVRVHYRDLLRGRRLPDDARAIWFVGDTSGAVIATGIRATLPATVGFDEIPTLVPAVGTRAYQSFTLTGAGPRHPAADVTVLWVEVAAAPERR